jgi:hypothetical protein
VGLREGLWCRWLCAVAAVIPTYFEQGASNCIENYEVILSRMALLVPPACSSVSTAACVYHVLCDV